MALLKLTPTSLTRRWASRLWLGFCLVVFLGLGAYQLDLPGLHYDEAKEAAVNAMQMVTGQPLTAFRDAQFQIGPWHLPLMVQDYIGALNPILAIPFLAIARLDPSTPLHSVVALRWLPLFIGALTLLAASRLARALGGELAAAVTAGLLAVNPAFVFWSRQGIFVTNLTTLCFMAGLLASLHWWVHRRPRDLWLAAFCCGMGLYAKLLFTWALGAMLVLLAIAWLAQRASLQVPLWPRPSLPTGDAAAANLAAQPALAGRVSWMVAGLCFIVPLLPLLLFNLHSGGTLASILGNLGQSYYGVDNRAYLPNLAERIGQVGSLLRGDFLWYLGEVYANPWPPRILAGLAALALADALRAAWRRSRARQPSGVPGETVGDEQNAPCSAPTCGPRLYAVLLPLGLLSAIVAQSAFTVSDLFITHYALFSPLPALAAGLGVAALWRRAARLRRPLSLGVGLCVLVLPLLWGRTDAWNTVRYHRVLSISGGYGGHSDAIYALAAYMVPFAPAAPLALDWGLDAPVRYLSVGQVNPIEVFGYASLETPDDDFVRRIQPFVANPDTLYLGHAPESTIFRGRLEALRDLAVAQGLQLHEVARFHERNGKGMFVVYRVMNPPPAAGQMPSPGVGS